MMIRYFSIYFGDNEPPRGMIGELRRDNLRLYENMSYRRYGGALMIYYCH